MSVPAFAKVNLCLYLGPTRPDGYHELVSVLQPLTLADELVVEEAGTDEVRCPGVAGENLALRALQAFRAATGYDGPGIRITIDKRIPVAAGMGGGSADAAAALRIIAARAGVDDVDLLRTIGSGLGADVPGLVEVSRALVSGLGEVVEPLSSGPPSGILVLPSERRLSTPEVFREADRLGLGRPAAELAAAAAAIRAGRIEWVNDLEPAALSLCPSIAGALDRIRSTGGHAMVSGSGPTVVGYYETLAEADTAARTVGGRATAPA